MESVKHQERAQSADARREENERSSEELRAFRHKLQRLLLSKGERPGRTELVQATGILDDIQCFENPIEWAQITECGLNKILSTILASDLPTGDDECGVAQRC